MKRDIEEKDVRRHKKYLLDLTATVAKCVDMLDAEMEKPSTPERGKTVAKISNALEQANDVAWHFGLELSLTKKRYKGQERKYK